MNNIIYLKVKLKSLAEEARIIRLEEAKAKKRGLTSRVAGLQSHRVSVVRPEARATLLAYNYLRGKTYAQTEQNAREAPNWERVRNMVVRYGLSELPGFNDWMKASESVQV